MNENFLNPRVSYDIDMKLAPVTKIDKRNTLTSKKFDDEVKSANFDGIVITLTYGQFRAIRKPDSRRMICKTYIFINSKISSCKT